jgi:hypothetical protein
MATFERCPERIKPTMLKLLIFILCFLLLIMLLVNVLATMSDRFEKLSIWKAEPWSRLKVPIIVATVVIGIVILLIFAIRGEKKHERQEKEFARIQGWTYSGFNDPEGRTKELSGKLVKICPEKEFTVMNCMTLESARRSIYLFRCRHRVRDGGGNRHDALACLIESDRFGGVRTQVDISGRTSVDGLLLSNQVDVGNSEFARTFIVTSKDPASAKATVNGSLQTVLLDSNRSSLYYSEVSIGPGGAVILAGTVTPIEDGPALADLARGIESAME